MSAVSVAFVYLCYQVQIDRYSQLNPPPKPSARTEAVTMSTCHLDEPTFTASLAQGTPIVITGLQRRMQGTWYPGYFIQRFGSHRVNLVDCGDESEVQTTVADFFRTFGVATNGKVMKLKVGVNCFLETFDS
jgi:hypothetical protein